MIEVLYGGTWREAVFVESGILIFDFNAIIPVFAVEKILPLAA
ncbi:MAG: hypothetical protein VW771_09040 [Gammaproteobacteria bacterium]